MAENKKLLNVLHKIAAEQNFKDYDIKVTPISSGGANFTSDLFTVVISSKGRRDLNLFAKIAAWGEEIKGSVLDNSFEFEQVVYTEVKDIYRQLEDKYDLDDKHRLRMPILYGADMSLPDKVIVMEDLASQAFTTYERTESITWEYGKAAITELAKLHALSMAFEHEFPEKYKYILNYSRVELYGEDNLPMKMLFQQSIEMALNTVHEENRESLAKFFKKNDMQALADQFKPLRREVLVHSDFRMSNAMHRDKSDGTVELIIIDYQTLRGGSPVGDLYFFIFTGTDQEFRSRYYKQLVEHYYSELRAALTRLGLDPDREYSREDFEFELKEKLHVGLAIAVVSLPIITVEAENASILDDANFKVEKTGNSYARRLNEIVEDFIRLGILDSKIK